MAINWDLYNTRLTIRGITQRERIINDFQNIKNQKGLNSPSCKTVLINDVEKQVFINSTNKKNIKSISPVLNTDFLTLGSKIYWKNKYWLLNDLNEDNDVFADGQIQKCNYVLPFQTTSTTIYNEPCIVIDATRSSSTGEDDGKVLTLTDTQALVYIQYNDKTKYLTEEKRIFLDQFTDKPKVYKITKADRISYMDGDKGLLQLTCDQEEYNSTTDSYEYKIADYISSDPTPTPTPTPSGTCLITNTKDVVYDYTLELKIGGSPKPLVSAFKDADGNIVDKTPIWSLDFGTSGLTVDNVHLTYNESYPTRCYLAVDNNVSFIGKEFSLKLNDSENLLSEFVLNLKVVSYS